MCKENTHHNLNEMVIGMKTFNYTVQSAKNFKRANCVPGTPRDTSQGLLEVSAVTHMLLSWRKRFCTARMKALCSLLFLPKRELTCGSPLTHFYSSVTQGGKNYDWGGSKMVSESQDLAPMTWHQSSALASSFCGYSQHRAHCPRNLWVISCSDWYGGMGSWHGLILHPILTFLHADSLCGKCPPQHLPQILQRAKPNQSPLPLPLHSIAYQVLLISFSKSIHCFSIPTAATLFKH